MYQNSICKMRGYFSGLIRLDGTFQAVAGAPGEITQLRPVVAVRGNLTINKALKLAELDPSKDTSFTLVWIWTECVMHHKQPISEGAHVDNAVWSDGPHDPLRPPRDWVCLPNYRSSSLGYAFGLTRILRETKYERMQILHCR